MAVPLAWSATGCGGLLYTYKAGKAGSTLEEARGLDAERYAPHSYWTAQAYLDKAKEEAAQAQYGDAWDLAATAEEAAVKAVNEARKAHRSRGR
jgi:hypothetical protein